IIVIDDGSSDNSINIVSNIKNEKIRILKQENKGLSAARNTGLKNATGNYILFVDSDDYIENSFSIKSMIEIARRKKCDIVIGNGKYFWNDEKNYYIYSRENYNINFFENGEN
ncbi:glycosyltransferase family 2 protein, partial [Clostridium perfringens]